MSAEGPDVLIWRMAADAMNLAVGTTRGLCNAAKHHEAALPLARKRINTLRSMGALLLQCADDFDFVLAGDDDRTIEEIVAEFSRQFGTPPGESSPPT